MVKRNRVLLISTLMLVLMLGGAFAFAQFQGPRDAYAGASVEGVRDGADTRALIQSNGSSKVSRIVYFAAGTHANGGVNTPVPSGAVCGNAVSGTLHYAEVKLVGTLAGTAPTLAIKWQNSKDNGATWTDVGTWTTINATVTPATQSQTVGDHGDIVLMNANTPVVTPAAVYGDCWRATYTYGGNANNLGSFSIIGVDK